MAAGEAPINRCPPGGAQGIVRLSRVTGQTVQPLDPEHGHEGPRQLAVIDESWCIGCTLCLKACPVDCIVGGPKAMHTVIEPECTGCELCIPVCPVDCISLVNASGDRTGWDAWSLPSAARAKARYAFHQLRFARDKNEHDERMRAKAEAALADLPGTSRLTDPEELADKRSIIEAALARARKRKPEGER